MREVLLARIASVIASVSRAPRSGRDLAVVCLIALVPLLILSAEGAPARADTSTGPSTSGTASTVSPSTVAVGGTLMFTVSGFPRGATVQILIDDGALAASPEASAIVATISIEEDGTASGSFELPDYVGLGSHWLRFRVSAGQDVPTSTVRTADYTNKSPYFTVAGVTVIGGAETIPTPTPQPDPTPPPMANTVGGSGTGTRPEAPAALQRSAAADAFPAVGHSILALSALLVLLSIVVVVNRRRLAQLKRSQGAMAQRGLHA